MKEDFLHYLWKFQKFAVGNLKTTAGEPITIQEIGQHNQHAGPDFFNSKVNIGGQTWAGTVEIHLKSSDWYAHKHETDSAYENVILHVVWEHDSEIYRANDSPIATLQLQPYVCQKTLGKYTELFNQKQAWIPCETSFSTVPDFTMVSWLEKLFIERLQTKSDVIYEELQKSQNHWEAVLFKMLCSNFGLKVNGDAFKSLADSIPFASLQKLFQNQFDLESALFGQAGLLNGETEDGYFQLLHTNYSYLQNKFQLMPATIPCKFFRLRPPNFPTLRLSQLSVVFSEVDTLFSKVIAIQNKADFYKLFDVAASEYWDTHYNFALSSVSRKKKLSKPFIDLLLINTIIPFKFCYAQHMGKDITEEILQLAGEIASEENSIILKFNQLRPSFKNAFESQGLLQLKNNYCDKRLCLQCAVGNFVLKE